MRDAQRRDGMRDDGRQAFTLNGPYKPAIELRRSSQIPTQAYLGESMNFQNSTPKA